MSLRLQKKSSRFLVRAFIAVSRYQNNNVLVPSQAIRFASLKQSLKNELIKRGIEPKDLLLA